MKLIDKFIENVNLDNPQKIDLIQTLLIVSSILVALKTQDTLSNIFMLFIFTSIIYYIVVLKDRLKPGILHNLHVLVIAATFSTLVNVNLFSTFWNAFEKLSLSLGIFLYLVYYLLLTLILWAALVKRLDPEKLILPKNNINPESQPTNISPQIQENHISKDYIKAQLDLSKMKMAGFLGGLLVLSNSILQTTEIEVIYEKLFLAFVLTVLLLRLIKGYIEYSKKLNEI